MDYLSLPMPVLWLLLVGLLCWRRQGLSRRVMLVATLVFLVFSLPLVGRGLALPLRAGAVPPDAVRAEGQAAIVVPTGGSWDDGTGRWWPTRSSIARLQAARRLNQSLGLPLVVSGGSFEPGQPPEAETLVALLDLAGDVVLETGARNSADSARAVAALLPQEAPRAVVLVTSPNHIARMRAALRHQGLTVAAVWSPPVSGEDGVGLSDLLPSATGLKLSRAALYEYAALASYLLAGHIAPDDL